MRGKIFRSCARVFVVAGLFVFAIQLALGGDTSRVSGSYLVLSKTELGPQTRVRLQIHLTNHGPYELHIQRLTLWDFSHPAGTQACAIVVHAGASVGATQEFTIPRSEYELWNRGARPRLVMEVQSPDGLKATPVVRLEQDTARKAD